MRLRKRNTSRLRRRRRAERQRRFRLETSWAMFATLPINALTTATSTLRGIPKPPEPKWWMGSDEVVEWHKAVREAGRLPFRLGQVQVVTLDGSKSAAAWIAGKPKKLGDAST